MALKSFDKTEILRVRCEDFFEIQAGIEEGLKKHHA
jgi:hypothetical protein